MQPKTKYIILSNYKQKVSCDYIIVKPSTPVLSAGESVGLLISATLWPAGVKVGYTNSVNKCPLSHLLFWVLLSWKLKPWKLNCVLPFSPAERTGSYAIKNHHITTIAAVCCLVCLFMGEILWKSILVLKIFFLFFFFLKSKPLKLAETDLNSICP